MPMSPDDIAQRGWSEIDVLLVTGDAYVDHPSFAMAILGRVLEDAGFRIAILSQPDWSNADAFRAFGRPRLFFAVSGGNMDSMINHYTANRKVRNDDAYSPGGKIGLRPDRATLPYCQRLREAFKGVPIIAGGVEASLRRLAHYDYWSDTVKRSILLDAKADLVAYGMGDSSIVEIARRLDHGESIYELRNMRGVAYSLGAKEEPPTGKSVIELPTFEEVKEDKVAFAEATRLIHLETNPYNAKTLIQRHDRQAVVCTPPRLPESKEAMDFFYDLPYSRKAHPSYSEPIPAFTVVKDSVTIMRGCFGGCTYCSITTHQGRIVQRRSQDSVVGEVKRMTKDPEFKGIVSDIGGPTANMYDMRCSKPEVEAVCKRLSCVHPKVCPLLRTSHSKLISLMREARNQEGVRRVFVASGVRMDLARLDPDYIDELTQHHVGGHLKVAQEHSNQRTLTAMKRPTVENFEEFDEAFRESSRRVGKEQYLVPYFISAHPGSDVDAMIELAVFLKKNGYKPEQVQDFIPAPFDIAACMYHTGLDPFTKRPVEIAKKMRDRKAQRALMQFFKPENYFAVRKVLLDRGRRDLIGDGCNALVPAKPPQEALDARRDRARREAASGDHVHSTQRRPGTGYRPGRRAAGRRERDRRK
ncbi:MAG: YgiQ family radical SAM protein [Planctomycetota bacterium]